jgi:hypothetical protein
MVGGDPKSHTLMTDASWFGGICLLLGTWVNSRVMANEVNTQVGQIVLIVRRASSMSPEGDWELAIQAYLDQDLREHAEMINEHEQRLLVLDHQGLVGLKQQGFCVSPYDHTNPKELAKTRRRVKSWIKRELRDCKKRFYVKYDFYKSYSKPLKLLRFQRRDWKAHLPSEEAVKQTA